MSRTGGKKQATIQFQRERMHRRYDFAKWTVAPVLWIVSTYAPLKALSGHKTSLTVTLSLTIAISLVTSAGLAVMYVRARKAEKEVERQRSIIKELEGARREVQPA